MLLNINIYDVWTYEKKKTVICKQYYYQTCENN